MARIRSIKPEFWSSPGIETLPMEARLIFIALWQWADDYGRGTAEPREIMGFVFPRDDEMTLDRFNAALGGIKRVFGVDFYRVEGRPFYYIPTWEKHQRIDKRAKASRHPDPQEGTPFDPSEPPLSEGFRGIPGKFPESSGRFSRSLEDSPDPSEMNQNVNQPRTNADGSKTDEPSPSNHVNPQAVGVQGDSPQNPPEISGKFRVGTGEQGNRGTDKKHLFIQPDERAIEPSEPSGEPSDEPVIVEPIPKNTYPQAFEEWYSLWPRKQKKRDALKAWQAARKRVDHGTLIERTQAQSAAYKRDRTEERFIPLPASWLRADGWENDMNAGRARPKNQFLAAVREANAAPAVQHKPRWQEVIDHA